MKFLAHASALDMCLLLQYF